MSPLRGTLQIVVVVFIWKHGSVSHLRANCGIKCPTWGSTYRGKRFCNQDFALLPPSSLFTPLPLLFLLSRSHWKISVFSFNVFGCFVSVPDLVFPLGSLLPHERAFQFISLEVEFGPHMRFDMAFSSFVFNVRLSSTDFVLGQNQWERAESRQCAEFSLKLSGVGSNAYSCSPLSSPSSLVLWQRSWPEAISVVPVDLTLTRIYWHILLLVESIPRKEIVGRKQKQANCWNNTKTKEKREMK